MPDNRKTIEVHQLTKRFPLPGGSEVVAVDRLSFSVSAGEVYGLLGPNGAGKTTTLRIILGFMKPTAGSASIDGVSSTDFPEAVKRRVGWLPAGVGVYRALSVREMLLFFADLYGMDVDDARAELDHLVSLLGLAEYIDQPCGTLSTGQRQRINLARALIHRPPVMLLDEPTQGLDVFGSQIVFEFITHLREQGKAVILCTHRLDEAERLCSRFGLLRKGTLVSEGTLQELRERTGCETLVEMFLKLSHAQPALALSL